MSIDFQKPKFDVRAIQTLWGIVYEKVLDIKYSSINEAKSKIKKNLAINFVLEVSIYQLAKFLC